MIQDDETKMASAIQTKWPRVKHKVDDKQEKVAVQVTCLFCDQSHIEIFAQEDCPIYYASGVAQANILDASKQVKHYDHCIVNTANKLIDEAIDDLFSHFPEDRPNTVNTKSKDS